MSNEVENSGQQLEKDIDKLCGINDEQRGKKEDKKKKEERCSGSGSSQASSKE